jgi:hypothetical protein
MSDFARMQEAWEAALEGDIERSFRLAEQAGMTRFDLSMVRRQTNNWLTKPEVYMPRKYRAGGAA